MNTYDIIERGRQAEQFLKYIQNNPYFEEMLDRMRIGLMEAMCKLNPNQTDEFKALSERFHFLPEIVNMAHGDVYIGAEALASTLEPKHDTGLL